MPAPLSRRELLRRALGGCAALPAWSSPTAPDDLSRRAGPLPRRSAGAPPHGNDAFSFLLLGDLHFDRPEHHDLRWLAETHPDDLRQVEDYTRLTLEQLPGLVAALRRSIAEISPRIACVVQAGDFVEGLCGSAALALRQDHDAVRFLRKASLGVPFLFTKGNHDITGPGAAAAFSEVFHPFLAQAARELNGDFAEPALTSARYSVRTHDAQFAFFDAYDPESLAWFEAVAARRTAAHLFVVVHPPVVPFGARSTWHLYSAARDRSSRDKLLAMLAEHEAFVLGGHIHRYSALARRVGDRQFAQLSTSSVVRAAQPLPRDWLSGVGTYTADQVRVEPGFSPATEPERRAALEAEQPFVRSFEYADLPGHAVITVDGGSVTARIHAGTSRVPWRTLDLCAIRAGTTA